MRAVVASFRVVLPLAFFAAIPMAVAAAQSVSMVEVFQPGERLTFEGRFGIIRLGEADARIWISDDPRRLVVQMKVKMLSYATVTLRLTEFVLADSTGST